MSKLEELLKYVSEHNDFYKNRIKEYDITNPLDITQWPVLTRRELQENRYNMFSDGYKTKYFNQQLRRQSSSGSSGMPVNVYWDYKDWYASNMSLWRRRWQWYGIKPSDKYVMFTLNGFNIKADSETVYYIQEPINLLSVNVSLIQNDEQYRKLVDIINQFNPTWMYIQPFVLNKLIQTYKQYDLKKPSALRYIESVGEILTMDLRRRAVEFFEIPLANMYGSEEMNGIAYENSDGDMSVLSDNVFVELMKNNKFVKYGSGETIITNLNNIAMPLIRYNQGDVIDISNKNDLTTIKIIKGRRADAIILTNEEPISEVLLFEIIAEANNVFNDIIKEYKYEFHSLNKKLICRINFGDAKDRVEKWFFSVSHYIKELFILKGLSRCNIDIEYSHEMDFRNGKRTVIDILP